MKFALSGVASLTGLLLLAGIAPVAAAVPDGWSEPVSISPSDSTGYQVNADAAPDGSLTAIWVREQIDSTVDFLDLERAVETTTSVDNGLTWTAPVTLTAVGEQAEWPRLATAQDGAVSAVWNLSSGEIQSSTTVDQGATWSAAVTISAAGTVSVEPQVVVMSDGSLAVVWTNYDGNDGKYQVEASTSADRGASWSAPVTISSDGLEGQRPSIAVSPDDSLTVVWDESVDLTGTGAGGFLTRTSTDGGVTWSDPVTVSEGGFLGEPASVVASPDGTLTIAWSRYENESDFSLQATTSLDQGVSWAAPVTITAGPIQGTRPSLVAAADGTLAIAWSGRDAPDAPENLNATAQVSTSTDRGGSWSAPTVLSAANEYIGDVPLVASADGSLTAAWSFFGTSLQTSTSTDQGATWSPVTDFSEAEKQIQNVNLVAFANGGLGLVWWTIDAAISDAVGNTVQASFLSVAPENAATGTPTPTASPVEAATNPLLLPLVLGGIFLLLIVVGVTVIVRSRRARNDAASVE